MSITIRSAQTIKSGVTLRGNPSIVKDGLIAYLDAGLTASYSGSGTAWHDLSGQGAHATLNGTVPFVNNGTASYFTFDGNSANCITSVLSQNYQDCTLIFYPDFTYNGTNANLAYGLGAGADRTMRFGNINGSSPWSIQNPGNDGDWAYPTATNYYLNGATITGAGNLVNGWNILGAARTNQWGDFAYSWGTGYFDRGFKGKLAAILLYDRVLTAEEQQQNYNAFMARNYGLQLHLDASNPSSYPGTGSTWYDISGRGNNASIQNTPVWTDASTQSYFTFSNDTNSVARTGAILPKTAYTKIAVFRVAGWFGNLMSGGITDGSDHAFWGFDTQYLQSGHNGNWNTVIDNLDPVPTNQWVFGAVTFNTTTGWKLYLQNHAPATNPDTGAFTPELSVVEVGGFNNGNYLNGDVAVAMIYDRALSDAEIAQIYAVYQPRFGLS